MPIPRSRATRPALNMDSTQCVLSVPMLITRAWAMRAMSSASSNAWAITGEAPSASRALAVVFMTK